MTDLRPSTFLEQNSELLARLASTFTGTPVIILPEGKNPDVLERQVGADLDSIVITLNGMAPKGLSEEETLAYYKGWTALQASAVKYKTHVFLPELAKRTRETLKESHIHHVGEEDIPDAILRTIDSSGFCTGIYQTVELLRRKRIIAREFEPLNQAFNEVMQKTVDVARILSAQNPSQNASYYNAALSSLFWHEFGIDQKRFIDLMNAKEEGRRMKMIGLGPRLTPVIDAIKTPLARLGESIVPEEGYWAAIEIIKYFLKQESEEVESGGKKHTIIPFQRMTLETVFEMRKSWGVQKSKAIDDITNTLTKNTMTSAITNDVIMGATDLHKATIIDPRLYKADVQKQITADGTYYYPEKRAGVMHEAFTTVRELSVNPETRVIDAKDAFAERDLEIKIKNIDKELAEVEKRFRSDINWVYDLGELEGKRNKLEREKGGIKKDLKGIKDAHEKTKIRAFAYDAGLLTRIEQEMEQIRPAVRTKVRNQEEGMLDEKKYFEYEMNRRAGVDSRAKFYWKWRTNRRDVATMLLVDASKSSELMADNEHSILDYEKESVLYLAQAIRSLGDRCAIALYNGESQRNVQIYYLQPFGAEADLPNIFPKIIGKGHNRDGAAIRWATDKLSQDGARTKFIFHIGDLEPSDVTRALLIPPPPGTDAPYRGTLALEDTVEAYNSARGAGIIPYGFAIRIKRPEEKKIVLTGQLNIKAVKNKETKITPVSEQLDKKFQGFYRTIDDPKGLPDALRSAYLDLTFS